MATEKQENGAEHQQNTDVLRGVIARSFPAEIYIGAVTPYDGAFTPELDEEQSLFDGLKGRRWTDVAKSLLHSLPDGFVLLTDEAYRAFLPAWLSCSLDNMNSENEVRNFVVFAFSTTAQQLRALRPDQRSAVRSILAHFAEELPDRFMRGQAAGAVANIERLERDLEAFPWLNRSDTQR